MPVVIGPDDLPRIIDPVNGCARPKLIELSERAAGIEEGIGFLIASSPGFAHGLPRTIDRRYTAVGPAQGAQVSDRLANPVKKRGVAAGTRCGLYRAADHGGVID